MRVTRIGFNYTFRYFICFNLILLKINVFLYCKGFEIICRNKPKVTQTIPYIIPCKFFLLHLEKSCHAGS